jgi:hypothetical protein
LRIIAWAPIAPAHCSTPVAQTSLISFHSTRCCFGSHSSGSLIRLSQVQAYCWGSTLTVHQVQANEQSHEDAGINHGTVHCVQAAITSHTRSFKTNENRYYMAYL